MERKWTEFQAKTQLNGKEQLVTLDKLQGSLQPQEEAEKQTTPEGAESS